MGEKGEKNSNDETSLNRVIGLHVGTIYFSLIHFYVMSHSKLDSTRPRETEKKEIMERPKCFKRVISLPFRVIDSLLIDFYVMLHSKFGIEEKKNNNFFLSRGSPRRVLLGLTGFHFLSFFFKFDFFFFKNFLFPFFFFSVAGRVPNRGDACRSVAAIFETTTTKSSTAK